MQQTQEGDVTSDKYESSLPVLHPYMHGDMTPGREFALVFALGLQFPSLSFVVQGTMLAWLPAYNLLVVLIVNYQIR